MKLCIKAIDVPKQPVFEFAGPTITIGRDSGCDLPLAGTTNVSGSHAQITLTPEDGFLIDLQSTNGTFLNDRRIDGRKKLRTGDYFRLGQTGPCFQILELDLVSIAPPVNGTVLEKGNHRPGVALQEPADFSESERVPVAIARPKPVPHRPEPTSAREPAAAAAPGQTRLMVVSLQRTNRNLMIGAGLAVVALLFIGGVSGLYLLSKTSDLSSKTADLDDSAKALQAKTEYLNQSVGKVASNVEKLTKNEEDDIFSRYADAVYIVEITVDKGTMLGTAFAIDKNGKLGTNAHISFPAAQALKAGRKVTVKSQGGKRLYPVISAISHSQYIDWPGGKIQYQTPDVGVLTVRLPADEYLPKCVVIAAEEDLRKLKPGAQLCYIGFPGWSKYDSLKKIEPHIYGGGLTRLMTLKEESGDYSNQYLLQHDLSSTGGASGSPIFNRHGKVVAIHNSGQTVSTSGPQGIVQNIPVGPKNGMRIDLLKEIFK